MSILHVPVTASNLAEWVRRAAGAINQLITGKQDQGDNLDSLSALDLTGHSGDAVVVTASEDGFELVAGGSGSGDLVSTNNLSDVANAATALSNLGGQPLDSTLTSLAAYNANGLIAQTAADTFAGRTLTGPAAGITVSNGNGVSGNPTLALANDLSALEGLGSTGLAARTAADTWAQRTITGSGVIAVTNGDGVSGNPTISRTFSGALVKKSADQTAANYSAGATVTFDAEEYDTDGYHDTGSNTDRLTVATAGYYRVGAHISVSSLAASDYLRIFMTRFNSGGSTQSAYGLPSGVITEISASPNIAIDGWSAPVNCSAGDYFTITLDTEADTSITVEMENSWFAIERLT